MKYILTDTFDDLLRQNGSYDEYYNGVRRLAGILLDGRTTAVLISELLDLYRVKKFVRVDAIATVRSTSIKVESTAELTLDEYIDLAMSKESGAEAAFYELLSMID